MHQEYGSGIKNKQKHFFLVTVHFNSLKINYYLFKYLINLDLGGLSLSTKYTVLCINLLSSVPDMYRHVIRLFDY